MATVKREHSVGPEDVLDKEKATWWADTSVGVLEHSRKFSQSVLEAGEPKLLSMKDREMTLDSFYQFVDEYQPENANEDLLDWLDRDKDNGVVQVYTPGSSYCDLVKCTVSTTTETIMAKCLAKELYVQYGGRVRKLDAVDHPLHVQNEFLRSIGYEERKRIQLEGISPELGCLFKLVAGLEVGEGIEDQIQLSGTLRVKESGFVSLWAKRFCVLIGSKIVMFSSATGKGKPSGSTVIYGCTVEEYRSKKWGYGIRILNPQRTKPLCLAFSSISEQAKWLKRLQKAVSKHPNEGNFSGFSLARIPAVLFHDKDLSSVNFANNFLRERPSDSKSQGNMGFLNELKSFPRLNVLSLAGNNLRSFPLSVCRVSSLTELDLSSNQLKSIGSEICLLSSLRTLHVNGNQLTSLPNHIAKLKFLSTLSLSFNELDCIPDILHRVSLLKVLNFAGNFLTSVPEDIRSLKNLETLDMRMNDIEGPLPKAMSLLPRLSRLNISDNRISDISMSHLPVMTSLCCSNNKLETLELHEGPLRVLMARENCISQITVCSVPTKLTILDLSRNALTSLPEGVCSMPNLEKLDISENNLLDLPARLFVGLKNLKVLKAHHNKFSVLPNEIAAFQLQELDLHGNQLVTLPPWLLVKLSNLEVLNVSDNQLVHLPPANHHDDHNNLVELLAGMNQLKNDVMDSISHLKRLKVLVLCHNRISELPQDSFHGLESLRVLNLSGNPITYIPSSLENCSSLEKLVVSGCRLNSSPSLDSLQHLQEIDFSHNDLENLQLSAGVGTRIKFLDISGNIHLELLELSEKTLEQLSYIDHVVVDELFEFDIPPGLARAEQIGQPPHGAWAYGIANVSGQIPELPCGCASHVAVSSVNRSTDAVYGVVDGGRSRDACSAVKTVLATIIEEEYDMYQEEMEEKSLTQDPKADRMSTLSEDSMDRLLYLRQSMLSCHRKMGAVGARSGSSVFACHIVHKRTTGTINLNLVSTGSCEGLLGREKGVVTVIPPHSLKTHRREMRRIAELGGTISEDFRLNTTTCGVSRLVGFYHLWPYMIPYPDISEIILSPSDRFLLIANDQVWRCLPHRVAEKIIMETSSPSYAAKKLRDTAMAFGCKGSVSIMLLKFNQRKMEVLLGSKPAKRPRSAHRSVSLRIPEDTHHYRLEIDTPGPLIDLSGGDEVGLHEVDEVTDIDALSYGSPEHEKWTNLDEPISPLTPPPGFGFDDDVFVSSTPSHPPPNIVARNTDSNVDTKQNGAEVVTSGFIVEDIENIESGIEEPTEVFDFDKDNLHEQILSNNLPNLLDSDAQDKNGEQQFYFCNSDGF